MSDTTAAHDIPRAGMLATVRNRSGVVAAVYCLFAGPRPAAGWAEPSSRGCW
ncbi:MAG: hypothetical protein OXC31_13055 [Spirochaetaceae bacterium]|nr:hypothetical protein [Spirochaetaceae bacterium]